MYFPSLSVGHVDWGAQGGSYGWRAVRHYKYALFQYISHKTIQYLSTSYQRSIVAQYYESSKNNYLPVPIMKILHE